MPTVHDFVSTPLRGQVVCQFTVLSGDVVLLWRRKPCNKKCQEAITRGDTVNTKQNTLSPPSPHWLFFQKEPSRRNAMTLSSVRPRYVWWQQSNGRSDLIQTADGTTASWLSIRTPDNVSQCMLMCVCCGSFVNFLSPTSGFGCVVGSQLYVSINVFSGSYKHMLWGDWSIAMH